MKITAKHITKEFGETKALDDVSIELSEGKIFGLLGPNGAGKTTFIRILNQMIKADAGTIDVDGNPLDFSCIEKIGYLPEERGLYKKMRVSEQILYFASLKGMNEKDAKHEIDRWFNIMEIDSWKNKRVEELSKGMQQKVQFIATVLHKPSLLILDEPFSGFDPVNAQIIKNEIIRMKKEGTTILLSTHNMNSVEELCDDISVIYKSKQILNGSVHSIKDSFAGNVFEVVFEGYYNKLQATLTPSFKILKQSVDGNKTIIKIELAQQISTNEVLQYLIQFGTIVSFQKLMPTMNEIFIQTIQQHNKSLHDGENV